MAESGLHKPLSQKEVLSCPYFGHCLWPAAKRLPERWNSCGRKTSNFAGWRGVQQDLHRHFLHRMIFSIQCLGGSDSELGVFICSYIFPIQWRAVRTYLEFPNHLIVHDIPLYQYMIYSHLFNLIYITVLDYSPGKWRPGLGAVRRLCRVRLDQTSKCKIGTMALRHP